MQLSIRELAKTLGVSPTEVSRKMTALGIKGHPQGKGKPTLLDTDDQAAIARALHKAAPVDALEVEVETVDNGLTVYRPAPLATRGQDATLARAHQSVELLQALEAMGANAQSFEEALIAKAREDGAATGHRMYVEKMNATLATYAHLERAAAGALGVGESQGRAA